MKHASERITSFHKKQLPKDCKWKDSTGAELGWFWRPISSVGLYVPGGLASYPSSVLMNAIPAQVAGVKKISMVSPTPNGKVNPLVLMAAKISGVTDIFKIGGAQAIAAMAYGTETIPQVYKIFGPGNQYVTKAKELVQQNGVAIDMPAGPSEVLVIADETGNPEYIAADLLSQAEHGADSQVILLSDNETILKQSLIELKKQINLLPRAEIAKKALLNSKPKYLPE